LSDERTIVGKVINKIKKRDEKAARKEMFMYEEHDSDFDF